VKFIRKNGRVIPIRTEPVSKKIGLKYGAIWGGISLADRSVFSVNRSLKKRRGKQ
jgi:hypothetical protein